MFKLFRGALAAARDERGVELVELLGFIPIVLLLALIAWQFILVGYTGIVASGTAREGARAAAAGEEIERAVIAASPGFDSRRRWQAAGTCPDYDGSPVRVQVWLEVPHVVFPFIGALSVYPEVSAQASMRCEMPFNAP